MRRIRQIKSSISIRYAMYVIFVVALQSLLLSGALFASGILKRSKESVCKSFEEMVVNRTNYLQREMTGRWSNIDFYVDEISDVVSSVRTDSSKSEKEVFFNQISGTLIAMMRTSGTTGGFFIFNEEAEGGRHPALYFRDGDPEISVAENEDLHLVMGPSGVAKKTQIPVDSTWHDGFTPMVGNTDFYTEPIEASRMSSDYRNLGYWSSPFSMTEGEPPVITYSVPVFDRESRLRGVMGVEISVKYINTMLMAGEPSRGDTAGYMIATQKANSDVIVPLIIEAGTNEKIFAEKTKPQFKLYDERYSVYRMEDENGKNRIYGCIKPLNQYRFNVPYDQESWVVAGLMEEDILFDFVSYIQSIYMLAWGVTVILGVTGGLIISHRIARPIKKLADEVKNSDFTKEIKLKKTGITELDQLSGAIETANHNLMKSTFKMSEIMDLLKIPIGAFEHKKGMQKVQVTNGIFEIFRITREEADSLLIDREVFEARLEEILEQPEADEHNIYRMQETPERWVKIAMTFHGEDRLGVVHDVTDEIREKHQIKRERDYDFLTKIYNRTALHREIKQRLEAPDAKISALVMLDLDGLKQINDTFGHKYGDFYIRETAVRLSKLPKNHAIVGRRSGDEFFIFFFGYESRVEIRECMREFYRDLRAAPLLFDNGEETAIQISAGISWYGVDSFQYDEMVQHADLAMYEVKRTTKNGFAEFGSMEFIEE